MEHQELVNDEEARELERVFNEAEPSGEVAAFVGEKLDLDAELGDEVIDRGGAGNGSGEHNNLIMEKGDKVFGIGGECRSIEPGSGN